MVACDYKVFVLVVLFCLMFVTLSAKEPVYYVSTEHINITTVNPEYFVFFNATAARPGRWDPKYYVHFHFITVDILFYEFRSNEYRRGFVEMHMVFCDLVLKDILFGPALRSNLPGCPVPAGEYRWSNMSIPDLPLLRTFPFRKGRIYVNMTLPSGAQFVEGYIDMEIKIKPEARVNKSKAANATKT